MLIEKPKTNLKLDNGAVNKLIRFQLKIIQVN